MFSTSTIASSTSSPSATARPPRVMVLIDIPAAEKTRAVITSESGIAVSVIKVVRMFIRKRTRTITTRMTPSRRASMTFSIARSINDFCEYNGMTRMSFGSDDCRSAMARMMLSVTERVSEPGCLLIVSTTLGPPDQPLPAGELLAARSTAPRSNAALSPRFTCAPATMRAT